MTIINYPSQPCPTCHQQNFWYREQSPNQKQTGKPWGPPGWVCGVCHPSPDQTIMLKARILKGNWQMNKLMAYIKIMSIGPERVKSLEQFTQGFHILTGLVQNLKNINNACLYIESGQKLKKCYENFHCYGCPNDYWPERELMELPSEDKRELNEISHRH